MISRTVVRRYAAALLETAWAQNAVELVESDLGLLAYTFQANPELKDALLNPLLPTSRKQEIVKRIFAGRISDLTISYTNLLIDKRREEAILRTEEEFVLLANERRGLVQALAVSAVPLSADETDALVGRLTALTGKKVTLTTQVDPSLIGGVLVRVGDRVLDGTVKGHLDRLRNDLIGRVETVG